MPKRDDFENRRKKIVVFERISWIWLPFVVWYVWRGFVVEYFTISSSVSNTGTIRQYHDAQRMRMISLGHVNLDRRYEIDRRVLETVDDEYDSCFRNSGIPGILKKYAGSDAVFDAFKKSIAWRQYHTLQRNLLLEVSASPGRDFSEKVPFIPDGYTTLPAVDRIGIPAWARVFNYLLSAIDKTKYLCLFSGFPFWVLYKTGFPRSQKRDKVEYRAGIRIYTHDLAFYQKYRSIDFLLDGEKLTSENVIFCIETPISAEYRAALENKRYHCVDLKKILNRPQSGFIRSQVFGKLFPAWIRCAAGVLSLQSHMIKLVIEVFQTYVFWTAFFDTYHVHHYIAYNDTLPRSIVRNCVLRSHGAKSWYYAHSTNTKNFFTPSGKEEYLSLNHSYLHFDHFVCWGNGMQRYYTLHPNSISQYNNLGCPWSEHIRVIQSDRTIPGCHEPPHQDISSIEEKKTKKTIGVFDTSFGHESPLQGPDMALFMEGLLRLLDDYPDIEMLFKMKNTFREVIYADAGIEALYERVKMHPRCRLMDGYESDPSEVMAAADLIVSACFTSPTIEALGARKKAVFYDAKGRFRGYYYDRFPNLVAHSYRELNSLVQYWLFSCTDEEFDAYILENIIGEIDAYADGRGITRFRDKLLETDEKTREASE
jgi:polysaccharide biosynthesis PFTS motif protein